MTNYLPHSSVFVMKEEKKKKNTRGLQRCDMEAGSDVQDIAISGRVTIYRSDLFLLV